MYSDKISLYLGRLRKISNCLSWQVMISYEQICASDFRLYDSCKRRTKRKQSKIQNVNPFCSVWESVSVQIPYIKKAQTVKPYQRYFLFSSMFSRVLQYNFTPPHCIKGCLVAWWLRHYNTNRLVTGSIPDGVIGIFRWHNPSGRTMALGSISL